MKTEAPLEVGTVLSVWVGLVKHVGIFVGLGPDGKRYVISNSLKRRGVAIETFEAFSEGRPVSVEPLKGELAPWTIVQRARQKLGEPWHLLAFNCEHFVHWALGLEPKSPQLRLFGIVVGLALVPMLASR